MIDALIGMAVGALAVLAVSGGIIVFDRHQQRINHLFSVGAGATDRRGVIREADRG